MLRYAWLQNIVILYFLLYDDLEIIKIKITRLYSNTEFYDLSCDNYHTIFE